MAKHEQEERVNPKKVLRRIAECLPESLGPHLRETVFALYAYSNDILFAEDIDAGVIQFETSAAASQLAKFCGLSKSAMRKRLGELEETGVMSSSINTSRNLGNVFKVYYSAGTPVEGYTRRGAQGIPAEESGIPVDGPGSTREAGTSVFSGSSGKELSGFRETGQQASPETRETLDPKEQPQPRSLWQQIEEDDDVLPLRPAPQAIEIPPAPAPAPYVDHSAAMDKHGWDNEEPAGFETCNFCGVKAAVIRKTGVGCVRTKGASA